MPDDPPGWPKEPWVLRMPFVLRRRVIEHAPLGRPWLEDRCTMPVLEDRGEELEAVLNFLTGALIADEHVAWVASEWAYQADRFAAALGRLAD